ncbi:hypothetical protein SISSUDRAFT_1046430 [Sistotremastrum suecicum HHB10207 ss-3]|uniref:Zn(2)-C6 fungal-type domain-containing protein n=1 Tax=Sistotremastrum suecicum HHB10207 ss-3 TaxID=1314776 RepID=A0A166DS01_9AGAM|nr:hypothetical protein SISSUDRAFT_1046430 [Sistotremastrum suecicum HHB10207 ss-3]
MAGVQTKRESVEDDGMGTATMIPRKRATRACDQCRNTKTKCERNPGEQSCRVCISLSIECTSNHPSRKRGPPKGYLHAVETRLHEVEATLGLMQSLPDARVQSILEDLRQDPYAKSILDRVNNSAFGPASISLGAESSGADNQPGRTSAEDVQEVNPFISGPTNAWQVQARQRFIERNALSNSTTTLNQRTNSSYGEGSSGSSDPSLRSSGSDPQSDVSTPFHVPEPYPSNSFYESHSDADGFHMNPHNPQEAERYDQNHQLQWREGSGDSWSG